MHARQALYMSFPPVSESVTVDAKLRNCVSQRICLLEGHRTPKYIYLCPALSTWGCPEYLAFCSFMF
jgi:hypothetical protein